LTTTFFDPSPLSQFIAEVGVAIHSIISHSQAGLTIHYLTYTIITHHMSSFLGLCYLIYVIYCNVPSCHQYVLMDDIRDSEICNNVVNVTRDE